MVRLLSCCAAVVAAMLLQSGAAKAEPADDLLGLWTTRVDFPQALKGRLQISRAGESWRAEIGGQQAVGVEKNGAVRLAFPAGAGEFRGTAGRDGRLTGFWIQPPGGGLRQAFATPLTLRAGGKGSWTAEVRPLPDRFTLYLKIFRGQDGALTAAFRNPEYNSRGGGSLFQVSEDGEGVHLLAGDPAKPDARLDAKRLAGPERLHLHWRDLDKDLDLHRATPAEAAAFTPRPAGEPPYAYRRPPQLADGWTTAAARDVGMDEEMLRKLIQRLIDADPAARRPGLIHSILVARHGRLVLEEYFFGHGREDAHDLRSAAKTYASVMLGAAMRQGVPISPASRVYEVMKGKGPFANPDPRKAEITLAHLLTHSSGLACDDNDDASPGNEGTLQTQTAQPDWLKYTLDLPMAHDPGTRYAYCSASINLAGGAISTAAKAWLPEYFDRTIATPLQFGPWYWDLQADGEGYLGGGAYVRPRDFLKLGQAYLDGGVWNGRRIVDADWVKGSTAPLVKVSPETTGLSPEDFQNFYWPAEDGLAWHLSTVKFGGRTYRDYAATGNGGQLLIVIPEFDLAVAITAGNYGQGGIWNRFRSELVPNEIVGAIRR